jgi:hypothetical protein
MEDFDALWDTFKARVREARTQQATVAASDGDQNNK